MHESDKFSVDFIYRALIQPECLLIVAKDFEINIPLKINVFA
jgi:hypothetical protein